MSAWGQSWGSSWGDAWGITLPLVEVPDVVGEEEADAIMALEGDGFVVVVRRSYSAAVPIGEVISQSPAAGVEAPYGSTVEIKVSRGPSIGRRICRIALSLGLRIDKVST